MCQVVAKITTLAQCNSCYLGGYRQVLLHFLELELDCDHPNWSCQVVDILAQTQGMPAVYVNRRVQYMTAIGKETWRRAHRAAVRRFALDGAKPTVNDLVAAQLDLRLTTRLTEFLSPEKIVESEAAIKSAYVKYAIEQMKAAYQKLPAQPAKKSRTCSIPGMPLLSGCTAAAPEEEDDQGAPAFDWGNAYEKCAEDFADCLANWRVLASGINYPAAFPLGKNNRGSNGLQDQWLPLQPGEKYHIIDDLLFLDMGRILKLLIDGDNDGQYGWLPHMALAVTPNNASSAFSEQMISACNLVMPEGRTALDADTMHMLACLRINRKFMEFMHKEHPNLSAKLMEEHLKQLVSELTAQSLSRKQKENHNRGSSS